MERHAVKRPSGNHRSPRRLVHLAALAGCAAALQPATASAKGNPVPPAGPAADASPPWVRSDGVPPPLPLSRTRAATPPPHPAIHPTEGSSHLRPLFPRAGDVIDRKAARRAAMERHPAGKGLQQRERSSASKNTPSDPPRAARPQHPIVDKSITSRPCSTRHQVQPGETLWGIASRWSRSQRPVEILRLTLEIYRMNREVIGPDPDLILPGQLLTLPERCER